MQPDRQPDAPAPAAKLKVREIREADLPAIAALLNRGFAFRSIDYWLRGLERHADRPRPLGYPTFGYCLDLDGAPVGVILPIVGSAADVARTSSRSFVKEPARRAKGSFRALLSQARRRQRTVGSLEP